jgi:hypothetical protein
MILMTMTGNIYVPQKCLTNKNLFDDSNNYSTRVRRNRDTTKNNSRPHKNKKHQRLKH